MDKARFTSRRTGELVPIPVDPPDWAFIPSKLPPSWTLPPELADLAFEAGERLGKLDGIGSTLPAPELLMRPLEQREAIQSSKLEGTYASPEDVLLYALNPTAPKSASDPLNSAREVFNYSDALYAGFESLKTRPMTINLIREMHERLLTGVRGREKTPGKFRTIQVGIGSERRFIPPPAAHVMDLMGDLENYINARMTSKRDRLVRAFIAHYQFEAIHPFLDGNGRIGRVLLALTIYKDFEHRLPWLYLSPFFERFKDEYIDKLFKVSANGEWDEWVSFCLRGTIVQANDSIARCEMLQRLRRAFLDRMGTKATKRTHAIIDRLFFSPIVSVIDVRNRCGVSYPTAKADIDALVAAGIVKKIPNHSPTTYYAGEIFDIAYADVPRMPSVGVDSPAVEDPPPSLFT